MISLASVDTQLVNYNVKIVSYAIIESEEKLLIRYIMIIIDERVEAPSRERGKDEADKNLHLFSFFRRNDNYAALQIREAGDYKNWVF